MVCTSAGSVLVAMGALVDILMSVGVLMRWDNLEYVVENLGKRKKSCMQVVDVCFVILPLQSTKEHMHIIRTLDIGRQKKLAMDT